MPFSKSKNQISFYHDNSCKILLWLTYIMFMNLTRSILFTKMETRKFRLTHGTELTGFFRMVAGGGFFLSVLE